MDTSKVSEFKSNTKEKEIIMKKWLFGLLASIILATAPAYGLTDPNVILPDDPVYTFELTRKTDWDDGYEFNGYTEMSGVLRVEWSENSVMSFIFYPFIKDVNSLPRLRSDQYRTTTGPIDVSGIHPDEQNEIIQQAFTNMDQNVLRANLANKIPFENKVEVMLEHYDTYVACNNRFYRAMLTDVRPLVSTTPGNMNIVTGEYRCAPGVSGAEGQPGSQQPNLFITSSKDGYVNMRAEPSSRSPVLMALQNYVQVTRLGSNGNWYKVELLTGEARIIGWIHNSQLTSVP